MDCVSSNSVNKHWTFGVAPSPSATTRFVRENQLHLRQVCMEDFVKGDADLTAQKLRKHCLAVRSCCAGVKQNCCERPDNPFRDTGLSGLADRFLPHWQGAGLHS